MIVYTRCDNSRIRCTSISCAILASTDQVQIENELSVAVLYSDFDSRIPTASWIRAHCRSCFLPSSCGLHHCIHVICSQSVCRYENKHRPNFAANSCGSRIMWFMTYRSFAGIYLGFHRIYYTWSFYVSTFWFVLFRRQWYWFGLSYRLRVWVCVCLCVTGNARQCVEFGTVASHAAAVVRSVAFRRIETWSLPESRITATGRLSEQQSKPKRRTDSLASGLFCPLFDRHE